MSVEVLPLGVSCNLGCTYCYQEPMRDAGNIKPPGRYSVPLMIQGLKKENPSHFTVFGGEPLLVPLEDLEKLWAFGLTLRDKVNSVQTNGALITDAHIESFKKYEVRPGFSIDGPDELNDTRWAGTLEKTREVSAKSNENIIKCLEAGISSSIITTLTKINASEERLPRLLEWFCMLHSKGMKYINLHFLEVDSPNAAELRLDPDELRRAAIAIGSLMGDTGLTVQPLKAMVELLMGDDRKADCIWHPCDPYTTSAVQGVLGDGQRVNCGRSCKDGIDWEKADKPSFIRQQILWNTPQEEGGCKDCKYFFACKGNCPGTALSGDWRNRTEHCETIYNLFAHFEQTLRSLGMEPVSVDESKWRSISDQLVEGYSQDQRLSLYGITRGQKVDYSQHGDSHGDHYDASPSSGHSDAPHGDGHGDHLDTQDPAAHSDTPHGDGYTDSHTQKHGDGHGDHTDVQVSREHGDSHGDHADTQDPNAHADNAHGDGHGDSGHGDSHGDHLDTQNPATHSDKPHGDGHTDAFNEKHGDSYSDSNA